LICAAVGDEDGRRSTLTLSDYRLRLARCRLKLRLRTMLAMAGVFAD